MNLSPEDRRFWVMPGDVQLGSKGLPVPGFNVDQTAKFFFNQSGSWLRLRMKADDEHPLTWLVLDGAPIEIMRKDPDNEFSARIFTLADIEPMAWSLHDFELEEIAAVEHVMLDRHKRESEQLAQQQADDAAGRKTDRQRAQMNERHPRQRQELADKQTADLARIAERKERAETKLAATIALVKAEAVLYAILPPEIL